MSRKTLNIGISILKLIAEGFSRLNQMSPPTSNPRNGWGSKRNPRMALRKSRR